MERNFAQIISYLFHPLLIPTYAVFILINLPDNRGITLPFQSAILLTAFIFLSTFVLPALLMLILKNLKVVSSLEMKTQRERVLPLLMMSIIYYTVYYLLKQGPQSSIFNLFMLGSTLLVLVSLLINYAWKISLHLVALGGLFGTLLALAFRFGFEIRLLIYCLIISAGITAFSRLKLKAHNEAQVYTSFWLGVLVMLGLFFFV